MIEEYEDCMPRQLEADSKYHSSVYNCHYCENKDCVYYYDFHIKEEN